MSLRIVIELEADKDIDSEAAYLAEHSMEAAYRFLQAAMEGLELLAEMPGLGSRRHFANARLEGLRMWPIQGFPNYLVFYQVVGDELRILRILHGARNIDQIFEQEP